MWRMLFVLHKFSDQQLNQRQLSETSQISQGTISNKLQVLKQANFVSIYKQGRKSFASITKEGQEFLEKWKETSIGEKYIATWDKKYIVVK
jgi:DNA-binding MarR family transcriptional regulator